MNNKKLKLIVKLAVVSAIYVALTLALYPLSYGAIQFRLSECLMMLISYNPLYGISLTLGCLISNLASPMGLIDVLYGTLATAISAICMIKIKNKYVSSLIPTIVNAIIIGLELRYYYDLPLMLSAAQVALGEFVVVTLVGVPLFKSLEQNSHVREVLDFKNLSRESIIDKLFSKNILFALGFMIIGLVLYFNLGLYNIALEDSSYDIYSLSRLTFNIVNNRENKYLIILLFVPILSFISKLCLKNKVSNIINIVLNAIAIITLIIGLVIIIPTFKETSDFRFYFYFVYFVIIIGYNVYQLLKKEEIEEVEQASVYSNINN